MNAIGLLLATAFRHVINEPTVEAGYRRFAALTDGALGYGAFRDAVDACQRESTSRCACPRARLQCHWHLEPTPRGVAAAQALPVRPARAY